MRNTAYMLAVKELRRSPWLEDRVHRFSCGYIFLSFETIKGKDSQIELKEKKCDSLKEFFN